MVLALWSIATQQHPSIPADLGSICDARKVINWVNEHSSEKWEKIPN
jgi:hypothetical protein